MFRVLPILLAIGYAIASLGYGFARPGFTAGASLSVEAKDQAGAAGAIAAINGLNVVVAPLFVLLYEKIGWAPFVLNTVILVGLLVYALRQVMLRSVNQGDADAICKQVKVYVAPMTGRNMFQAADDPDIDVVQYDGHSNLGRNIENSIANAPDMVGSKIFSIGACATTDRSFLIRNRYPNPQSAQLIEAYLDRAHPSWREDMARGDCLFAATGVTTGSLLSGVKFRKDGVIETETVVMRSVTGTTRWIEAEHRQLEKYHL